MFKVLASLIITFVLASTVAAASPVQAEENLTVVTASSCAGVLC